MSCQQCMYKIVVERGERVCMITTVYHYEYQKARIIKIKRRKNMI